MRLLTGQDKPVTHYIEQKATSLVNKPDEDLGYVEILSIRIQTLGPSSQTSCT